VQYKIREEFKTEIYCVILMKRNYQYYLLLFLERSLYMTGSRSFGPERVNDVTMQKYEVVRRQVWLDQRL